MLIQNRRPYAVGAVLVAALLFTAGCTSGPGGSDAKARGTGNAVVAPGKPGEPARTLSPEEAAKAVPDTKPNSAEIAYVEMMITHHGQALKMTRLAKTHARAEGVKRVAERISATQGPEIKAMEGWLKENGVSGGASAHAHMAMPGMATDKQLAALRDARGGAFDDLFLKLMITHHQGGITMATDVLSGGGGNVRVEEMATDLIAQQTREVTRMRAL